MRAIFCPLKHTFEGTQTPILEMAKAKWQLPTAILHIHPTKDEERHRILLTGQAPSKLRPSIFSEYLSYLNSPRHPDANIHVILDHQGGDPVTFPV